MKKCLCVLCNCNNGMRLSLLPTPTTYSTCQKHYGLTDTEEKTTAGLGWDGEAQNAIYLHRKWYATETSDIITLKRNIQGNKIMLFHVRLCLCYFVFLCLLVSVVVPSQTHSNDTRKITLLCAELVSCWTRKHMSASTVQYIHLEFMK